jgi:F-type H+-transporting ATPase subunit a
MTGRPGLSSSIEIGNHPEWHAFGWTFNADTIWSTVVAGVIVVALGLWARKQLTKETEDHVPTKLQLIWETIVGQVTREVESNLGRVNPTVVTYAVALFFFILIANWIEVVPTDLNGNKGAHLLPSPTADTNLTYAMAIMAMVGVWGFGIRQKGLKGYFKHYMEPYPWLLPLELLQDLLKPVTLALRLFGNIFAGGIMLALIGGLVSIAPLHIPLGGFFALILNVVWKLFDTLFLGALQAFIFALLTVLYFGMAAAGHGEDETRDEEAHIDTTSDEFRRREDTKEGTPVVA